MLSHFFRAVIAAGVISVITVWRTSSPPQYDPKLLEAPGSRALTEEELGISQEIEAEWVTDKTCLVTGSNGMFGLTLVDELLADGWRVIATHRAGSDVKYLKRLQDTHPDNLRLINADVTDRKSLMRAVPQNLPVLFHVAARIDTSFTRNNLMYMTNVLGTRNVVNVALARNVGKFIHTSSISVYFHKDHIQRPITENLPRYASASFMGYAHTKYLSELEVEAGMKRGLYAVILQPGGIIGKYDTSNWARLPLLLKAEALPGTGPAIISCAYGKNVARAHINAASMAKSGESYVLGGPSLSFHGLANLARELADLPMFGDRFLGKGKGFPVFAMPGSVMTTLGLFGDALALVTGDAYDLSPEIGHISAIDQSVDSSKATRDLAYDATTPVEASVGEMVAFLKENNLL